MPQLQQLMMLLQQNQNLAGQVQNQNNFNNPQLPQSQNNQFGSGLMQAAQILAQSQQQTSRFDQMPQSQSMGNDYDRQNFINNSSLPNNFNFQTSSNLQQNSNFSGGNYMGQNDLNNQSLIGSELQSQMQSPLLRGDQL